MMPRTTLFLILIITSIPGVAAYNPMIPVKIYSDGGPADSLGVKTYGVLSHSMYLQGGQLTKDGFIPYGNPLPANYAYDPSDTTIPGLTRKLLALDPGVTVETLRLISGKYVVTLIDWLVFEGLPGITGIFIRSPETYSIHGTPYVMVNRKGQPINPQKTVVSIHAQSPVASESGPQNGQFVLKLAQAQPSDTVLHYKISGTARNGKDYQRIGSKVTVAAGQTYIFLNIIPIDDSKREKPETVILTLVSKKYYKLDKVKKTVITIADND